MGTCVSKCYPTSIAGSGTSSCSSPPAATPLAPAGSCNAVAVHLLPFTLPSPSTSSSSSSSFKAMPTSSSSSSFKAMATSSSSSSSFLNRDRERDSLLVECDVVVLDPNNKKPPPPIHIHPGRSGGAATSKRARPVSPLATRPAPSSHHKKKKAVVRSAEPHADAQARKKKKKRVPALEQHRLHHRVPPPLPTPQVRSSVGAPEDELTNPLISMDCFIFL